MKVYYSRMHVTPRIIVEKELSVLNRIFGKENVLMYNGGVYDPKRIILADCVIVTGYNGQLKGKGVYSEITTAIDNKKEVYLLPERYDTTGLLLLDAINSDQAYKVESAFHNNTRDFYKTYCALATVENEVFELKKLAWSKQKSYINDATDEYFFINCI